MIFKFSRNYTDSHPETILCVSRPMRRNLEAYINDGISNQAWLDDQGNVDYEGGKFHTDIYVSRRFDGSIFIENSIYADR